MPLSMEERLHFSRVAQGLEEADLLLVNGKVANVYTGEIIPSSVSISRGRIACVKPDETPAAESAREKVSVDGSLLVPGYIEPHSHPWVIYNPVSLGNWSLCRGTTTHIMDNLPFYQHVGPVFFERLAGVLQKCPARFYWEARIAPQSLLPDEEELFSAENIDSLLKHPEVVAIAEITRWNSLLGADTQLLKKLVSAINRGKRIDGHTAGCKNAGLNALSALGVTSCHEPISGDEALERLRLGMWVMLRNSSLRSDLYLLLKSLKEAAVPLDRVMMTTDAAEPFFLVNNGFIDGLLQVAVEAGVEPLTALRMVTLNPATYFGLEKDLGSIAPGRYADILFLDNLENFLPRGVMMEGKLVFWNNKNLQSCGLIPQESEVFKEEPIDWAALNFSPNFQKPSGLKFGNSSILAPPKERVPLIELISSGITRLNYLDWDGRTLPEGVQYCSLLGRRGEYLSSCFIRNFAPGIQGMASSFTTSMGVLVIGSSLKAMHCAAIRLYELGGGIILWENNSCLYELPLEIAGMMSVLELHQAANHLKNLYDIVLKRGFKHNDLLLCILFLSCDFLPSARITPLGILDVKKGEIIYPPQWLHK